MKSNRKNLENPVMDQTVNFSSSRLFFIISFILSFTFIFHSLNYLRVPKPASLCNDVILDEPPENSSSVTSTTATAPKSDLHHVVFAIAASSNLWHQRKNYIKSWWRPGETRGFVWLDRPVSSNAGDDHLLPVVKISSSTAHFKYSNRKGHRSAIRISRIVSETLRLGLKDVRWLVMGDDDTYFVPDNVLRVLSKYDHNQFYYVGSTSESHTQNIQFSYGMAYGGGGFAISYPLAVALEKMQDRCIQRYADLHASDDRIQACMAELGVPLTKEPGFHQYDVYGSLFGLLASHPIAPLVSIHHLDVVDPIIPNLSRLQSLERLRIPIKLDSAALMQQSICYDNSRNWTVSVSWGYAVQILRGIIPPREVERVGRTFISWYRTGGANSYIFNTRPFSWSTCQKPFVYYLSNAVYNGKRKQTATEYLRHQVANPDCNWNNTPDPSQITRVEIYKKQDPYLWEKSPRRNCCRMLPTDKQGTMAVHVGVCRRDEVIERL